MAQKRTTRTRNKVRSGSLFENKLAWISAAIIVLILIQLFVFRDEGVYSLLKLKQEIRDMEAHISRLEIEKAEMESERDRLLNDPEYLERIDEWFRLPNLEGWKVKADSQDKIHRLVR